MAMVDLGQTVEEADETGLITTLTVPLVTSA